MLGCSDCSNLRLPTDCANLPVQYLISNNSSSIHRGFLRQLIYPLCTNCFPLVVIGVINMFTYQCTSLRRGQENTRTRIDWSDQENQPPVAVADRRTPRSEQVMVGLTVRDDNRQIQVIPNRSETVIASSQTKGHFMCSPRQENYRQPTISRRNERERNRVKLINLGFDRLREVVPAQPGEQLSKISTLKKAIWYIEYLDRVLHGPTREPAGRSSSETASKRESVERTARGSKKRIKGERISRSTTRSIMTTAPTRPIEQKEMVGSVGSVTGTASWISPIGGNEFMSVASGERPLKHQRLPSPVFPPHWDTSNLGEGLTLTPRMNQTTMHLYGAKSTSTPQSNQDSGYASLRSDSIQQQQPLSNAQHVLLQQQFLYSLENLLPLYNKVLQPMTPTPGTSEWSQRIG